MFTVYRINNNYDASSHKEFLCDSDLDILNLPKLDECAAGSMALVMNSGNFYILTNSGNWELFPNN